MKRRLRYTAKSYNSLLRANPAHAFAMRHALRLYQQRAIYSFIPKNACSTMRFSLAVANGCIADERDFNWIHRNNETFAADLESLLTAEFTFVILRCPFARLASVYLDKIVGREVQQWALHEHERREFEPDELTFRRFVSILQKPGARNLDIHWRPQVDFLVYAEYDAYFSLENFALARQELEKRLAIDILDARPLTRHGTDRYQLLESECYADVLPHEIQTLKRSGQCPAVKALYDDETVSMVRRAYADDIEFYATAFDPGALLFA
jgi:hypothetical protein